LVNEYQL